MMSERRRLLMIGGLLVLAGCEHAAQTSTSQPARAQRLLSAAPNVTEICCALGLADRLVGRTRYCTYPPTVEVVPSIGALNDLNVEALLELAPDLILVSGTSRTITEKLNSLGLRQESLPDYSLDDLFTSIARVGELSDRQEYAQRLTADIKVELDAIATRYAKTERARVLIVTAPLPDPPTQITAAGPGSFYDDLLRLAGHENAAAASGRPFAPITLEFILRTDPDVIIELAPNSDGRSDGDVDARGVWAKVGPLKAVKAERVYVLVRPSHFILGPRIGQTLEALCQAIAGQRNE